MHKKKEDEKLIQDLKDLVIKRCNYLSSKKILLEKEVFEIMKLFYKTYYESESSLSFGDIMHLTQKSKLPADIKKEITTFTKELMNSVYSGFSFNQKELHQILDKFKSIIDDMIEEKKNQSLVEKSVKKVVKIPFIKRLFIRKKGADVKKEKKKEKQPKEEYSSVRKKYLDEIKDLSKKKENKSSETKISKKKGKLKPQKKSEWTSDIKPEEFSYGSKSEFLQEPNRFKNTDIFFKFKKSSSKPKKPSEKPKIPPLPKEKKKVKSKKKPEPPKEDLKIDKETDFTADPFAEKQKETGFKTPKQKKDDNKKKKLLSSMKKTEKKIDHLNNIMKESSAKKRKRMLHRFVRAELMEDRLSNYLNKKKKKTIEDSSKHILKLSDDKVAEKIGEYIDRMHAKRDQLKKELESHHKEKKVPKPKKIPPKQKENLEKPKKTEEKPKPIESKESQNSHIDKIQTKINNIKDKEKSDKKDLDYENIMKEAKEFIGSDSNK